MAKYENEGYCPSNDFFQYGTKHKVSENWEKANNILGDRKEYMVYPDASNNYGSCYIVDALEGIGETIGIEIAVTLSKLIPICEYPIRGRKIVCVDVINPYKIPSKISEYDGKWCLASDEDAVNNFLFEDERYLVVVKDELKKVSIYLYKK